MKDKIFNALKQAYSSLGLGDALLQAQAETLASLGFVTDENLDAVVKAQETQLKAYQAANDKRVADALAKAKDAADKDKKTAETAAAEKQGELQKMIDELTKKAEAQTSELQKQADELKKQQEIQSQLDELRKKAEAQSADFEKRKAELLDLINGTKPEDKPEPPKDPQPKPEQPQDKPFDLDAFRKSLIEGFNKQIKSYTDANAQQTAEILATNKSLAEQVQALVKENAEYKAAQAAENRKNFILSKARELQIPEWRINEGFTIAPDATEDAITTTLTTVSNNIRANMLPQDGVGIPNIGGGNATEFKAEVDKIAEALVQNI